MNHLDQSKIVILVWQSILICSLTINSNDINQSFIMAFCITLNFYPYTMD
ncbi:hypothetical protein BH23THE1_BH23THE1_31580 [soil metagenome]